ncbi:MAG: nicotinamide-nucleotide amidohydrolase family protein [Gammaproteobacteria bacterium]|nr:nicotinamide-nucleotide amidohydrolase family protein [Gammaproteobacteria bacterium]
MNETDLEAHLIQLSGLLKKRSYRMATAESCTGGWVAKAATDLAGSSDWFDRGLVTYSNDAKQELLGVSIQTLDQYGAVSEQTVIEMAEGLLRFDAVSIGVAISGIAGPGGGSDEKPVGTVWIAWKDTDHSVLSHCYFFTGNRQQIRLQAAIEAVKGLILLLKSDQ